jgi:ABC-type branched-subunit amino acid transport system ATPase component
MPVVAPFLLVPIGFLPVGSDGAGKSTILRYMSGRAPVLIQEIFGTINKIARKGMMVLMVE